MRTGSQPRSRAASTPSEAMGREATPRLQAAAAEGSQLVRAAHLVRAWAAVVDRWKWRGTTTLDRNLSAFTRHYRDEGVISFLPPPQLVADWRCDGCPDPALWIEAKLATIQATDPPELAQGNTPLPSVQSDRPVTLPLMGRSKSLRNRTGRDSSRAVRSSDREPRA